jgi:hypothetical protein
MLADDLQSELIALDGVLEGGFGFAGSGHSATKLVTAGVPSPSDLDLRVPDDVLAGVAADTLLEGCAVRVAAIAWRYADSIQVGVHRPGDLEPYDCGPLQVLATYPLTSTRLAIVADRAIDPASVAASGNNFTVASGALTISGATVEGNRIVLTTSVQTPDASYSIDVDDQVTDYVGTALTGAPVTVTFSGYNANATVLISEVTDHPGATNARYLELYNGSNNDVWLSGWEVARYSNGAVDPAVRGLDGLLPTGQVLVLAQDETDFTTVWPAATPYAIEYSGHYSANGNDAYVLRNGEQDVDAWGVPGVNGIGEPWEAQDSVATRDVGVTRGTPTWTAGEWTIVPVATEDTSTPGVR